MTVAEVAETNNDLYVAIFMRITTKLSRVAVLGTSTQPGSAQMLREVELVAKAFGVKLQYLGIRDPKDIETAFREAGKGHADGVLAMGVAVLSSQRTQVVELAVKSRLPAIYYRSEFVEDGGLVSYAVNLNDLARRAATYMWTRSSKAPSPPTCPWSSRTKFEFIINLKAAKQIGLMIPPNVLARADRVIR